MSERATRPLNQDAVKAADDDLYSKHADDPRPNALYDENGNRKPLSANDPDQAGLRQEWMDSYKANGGQTESTDLSGTPTGQTVLPCGQKAQVDPLIDGDSIEIDDSDIPEPDEEPAAEEGEPAEEEPAEEEPEAAPEETVEIAVTERLKGQPAESDPAESEPADQESGDEGEGA